MKALVVYDNQFEPLRSNFTGLSGKDEAYLFSLSSRNALTRQIKDALNGQGVEASIIDSAGLINDRAGTLKQKYIQFIAELPDNIDINGKNLKEYFSIDETASAWWLSLLAEKSTFKSESINRLVQLDSIISVIRSQEIEKVIYCCSSSKLANALKGFCREQNLVLEKQDMPLRQNIRQTVLGYQGLFYWKHVLLMLRFTFRYMIKGWKIRRRVGGLQRPQPSKDSLMMISGYPNFERGAADNGVFRSKFFPYLQEELEGKKKDILWMQLYVDSDDMSFDESMNYAERFIQKGYHIRFSEEYRSLRMDLSVLWEILTQALAFIKIQAKLKECHHFEGYNFYSIVKDDWYSSFVGTAGYIGRLYYRMFQKIFEQTSTEQCLYICEMQQWEKALLSAGRAAPHPINMQAYLHCTISDMLLNFFNSPKEISGKGPYAIVRPDKIICNGRANYDHMIDSGWPKDDLTIAEAIRYNYLKPHLRNTVAGKDDFLLVACSINPEENSALLNLVYDAFGQSDMAKVIIKPHPFVDIDRVLELSGLSKDTLPFQIVYDPIEELLAKARIVIVGESGVSLQALAFDCELIIMNFSEWINMSPLKGVVSESIHSVSSVDELRHAVTKIFNTNFDPANRKTEAADILNRFFYFNETSDVPEKFLETLNV